MKQNKKLNLILCLLLTFGLTLNIQAIEAEYELIVLKRDATVGVVNNEWVTLKREVKLPLNCNGFVQKEGKSICVIHLEGVVDKDLETNIKQGAFTHKYDGKVVTANVELSCTAPGECSNTGFYVHIAEEDMDKALGATLQFELDASHLLKDDLTPTTKDGRSNASESSEPRFENKATPSQAPSGRVIQGGGTAAGV